MSSKEPIWIVRDYLRCSGCRKCEIACSLYHENQIWPEASRIRVFMLVPGIEVPHFCAQCEDYPCIDSCPTDALSVSKHTGAVLVNRKKCTGCGLCLNACPGRVPHIHPTENYAVICDLCGGKPRCAKVCQKGGWHALKVVPRESGVNYKLYARRPREITRDLAVNLFGETSEEVT